MTLHREPTVHFVVVGALLFVLHAAVSSRSTGDRRTIVVSNALVEAALRERTRVTGAAAGSDDARAFIEQYVDEEVLYREALALRMDEGDPLVRRRLIQKMQFLSEDVTDVDEPTEAELRDHLAAHVEVYAEPARVAFTHVFFGGERHGARADADARVAASSLARDGVSHVASASLGDPFLHGQRFSASSASDVRKAFDVPFAAAVLLLPVGAWSEPIASTYGVHLVFVTEKIAARVPLLDEIRGRVHDDLVAERRKQANARSLALLRAKYRVDIAPELPKPALAALDRPEAP